MAGLDEKNIDFTGATMEQRYGFLDEITPLLDKIDEFIYAQRMATKFPDERVMGPGMRGQPQAGAKKFKGFKRPTE